MLHKVGLLPASNGAQINFAYDFYKDDTPNGWKMSAEFKKTFCTNVNVYFVGLWDCVASVGTYLEDSGLRIDQAGKSLSHNTDGRLLYPT
jgi:uncharacterized protein (DUF2235 family)